MSGIKQRIRAIEKKLTEIENRRANEPRPLRIIFVDIEAGEKPDLEPGSRVIHWGAGDEVQVYRYDPSKPNGGRPELKKPPKTPIIAERNDI